MQTETLDRILQLVETLSNDDQQTLVKLIQQRQIDRQQLSLQDFQNQLAAMAQDPEIQAELTQIQQEFSLTEQDGLEQS